MYPGFRRRCGVDQSAGTETGPPMGVADPPPAGRSEDNDCDSGPTKEDLW